MPEPAANESPKGGIGGFFSRHHNLTPFEREEQGMPPFEKQATMEGSAGTRRMTLVATDGKGLLPHDDKLLVFRALTGIDTVPVMQNGYSKRTAPNVGIYTRVIRAERAAKRGFSFYSILINVFLGMQIIVAAILTALGAANGPHAAVTAFGAINTIIAGAMTYLKGAGLPQKLKHHHNEWKVVREYIEQREREFCLADCPLDVNEELQIVEELYKKTKTELEAGSSQGSYKSGNNSIVRRAIIPLKSKLHEEPKKPDQAVAPPEHPERALASAGHEEH